MELDSYFEELMRIVTSPNFVINVDAMHKYVAGPTALKKMMHMLSN